MVRMLGSVVVSEEHESLFGELLAEKHPTKTLEVRGQQVPALRWVLYWSGLEQYHPQSAEALAAARATREKRKEERADRKFEEEHPLFIEMGSRGRILKAR